MQEKRGGEGFGQPRVAVDCAGNRVKPGMRVMWFNESSGVLRDGLMVVGVDRAGDLLVELGAPGTGLLHVAANRVMVVAEDRGPRKERDGP